MRMEHHMASRPSRPRKRAMNVFIPLELAEEARAHGTNVSAVLERALEAKHRERRREEWRKANRDAIREGNEELAEHGLWSDALRTF
jgi:post-segregation antitoxin (ccd killing protein)